MLIGKLILPLFEGTLVTLQVFAITFAVSLPLAILLASIQAARIKIINLFFQLFIMIERGTPLLLQMMFVFFGLPYMGVTLDRETSIYLAFVLNYTAYFMEILRGGINSVDSGQLEACQVLGYSRFASYVRVILPQALQACFPSIGNEVLTLIKDTSLITVLGASELLKAGRSAVNTYGTAVPFIYVGIIYLMLTTTAEFLLKKTEKKMDPVQGE
ncbi:MAG: amino acid ABC transporter permease [Erysipelotrichaceae bacterium]|nr:amino acid ABC transporter permease [Erysipelotrichaceae bacterium]